MITVLHVSAKRADIIAAAITEFHMHGFGGARVDEIAVRAKVEANLYRYFPSKEELFDEIVRKALTQHPADENGVYDASRPVKDQLRELIDGYLTVITAEQYIALARVVTAEFIRNRELARAVEHNAPEDRLDRFFSAAMADGVLRTADAQHAAMQITALLKAFFFWPTFTTPPDSAQRAKLVDDCVAIESERLLGNLWPTQIARRDRAGDQVCF